MNKYYITRDGRDGVNISLHHPSEPEDNYLKSFINIWIDDEECGIDSPFKSIEDAEIFAEVIVKLLKTAPLLGEKENDA